MAKRKPKVKEDPALSYIEPALRPFAVLIDDVKDDPKNVNSHSEKAVRMAAAAIDHSAPVDQPAYQTGQSAGSPALFLTDWTAALKASTSFD